MWDYNNENINDEVSDTIEATKSGKAFRQLEKKLAIGFKVIFYSTLIAHFVLIIAYYVTLSSTLEEILIVLNGLQFVIEACIFMKVYHTMYYLQWYEYQRTRCQMNSFGVYLLMAQFLVQSEILVTYNISKHYRGTLNELNEYCKSNYNSVSNICYFILTLITDINILYVFFAWIIIKQKSSDDILNGINKLEGLLIVSIFQIYKQKG